MAAGLAGGIGLSGGACGALGAAIWILGMNHNIKEGKKLDVLKRDNRVCFEFDTGLAVTTGKTACDWGMNYRSVIGFGRASFVEDSEEKRRALEIITAQYADKADKLTDGAVKETFVFKVDIESMTGKKSG